MKLLFGVYIHLPLCDVKCAYCDFFSLARRHEAKDFWPNYLKRLKQDLTYKLGFVEKDYVLASIFFGGGTPSRAPGYVFREILALLKDILPSHRRLQPLEISAEANPESLSPEKAKQMFLCGINRLNVGIQSRDPAVLRYLGRLYSKKAYESCLTIAREAGFTRLGVDFIHGVPGLKLKTLLADLEWAMACGVTHISAYSLTVEEGTSLASQIRQKQKKYPSALRQYLHYQATTHFLAKAGFRQYEVSNFALPGHECLHNLLYWKYRPYLGLGVAAHSFLTNKRIREPRQLNAYLASETPLIEIAVPQLDFHIGSVRLLLPQSLYRLQQTAGSAVVTRTRALLSQFAQQGYLTWLSGQRFCYTAKGLLVSDSLLQELADNFLVTKKRVYTS